MRQLLQNLGSGATTLADVPVPAPQGPHLVVRTRASVISAGTERMLVEFGRANLLEKARSQPEKVRQVLDKMRTEGLMPTLDAVRAKLDAPIPLGYCAAGTVVETGVDPGGFALGERVVTNGPHAEYVRVSHTLAARIPDGVSFEHAAYTPLAAIGLQGIRLAAPTLGETVVVFGLGLIGLLTVQLLRADGCRVIGIDPDPDRLALGESFGAVPVEAGATAVSHVEALTDGVGADAVLLTLASSSDEPVHEAALMSRKRGRLVLVGVTGLSLSRDDFYEKELSFTVSCSYGPGRYDSRYEEMARDYPLPFVRWTEQRNFQAVLHLMESRRLDPESLTTHRFDFEDAPAAYDLISGDEPSLGVVLTYRADETVPPPSELRTVRLPGPRRTAPGKGGVGVIGAGNFAIRTLLPALREAGAELRVIASSGGTSGSIAGGQFGFERSTTDVSAVLHDPAVDTVFVLTRHDTHAALAKRALAAGKHVFVEKPLALEEDDLGQIADAAQRAGRLVMVGFNRRFAPLAEEVRGHLRSRSGPLSIIATVNAGEIPGDHWTQAREIGGGRIVGEACHWLDLARSLVGAPITQVDAVTATDRRGRPIEDIAHITISFDDGSTAVVHYLAHGAKSFPKERIDFFWDGKTVVLDNWRRLERHGVPGPLLPRRYRMDKGHEREIAAWLSAVRKGGPAPIPLDELLEVSRAAILAGRRAAGTGTVS